MGVTPTTPSRILSAPVQNTAPSVAAIAQILRTSSGRTVRGTSRSPDSSRSVGAASPSPVSANRRSP
jgi:hypothetical protein